MSLPSPLPTPGRAVHYVLANGEHRPAEVIQGFDTGRANLRVTLDTAADVLPPDWELLPATLRRLLPLGCTCHPVSQVQVSNVPYDEGGVPGTWHFPERV